ncbi:MAG: bifunctional folylpolyglutamate synthase/dihydrofolate synthase [Planctomycetes bacterium]|nr:bifunctional folylpolyglutamate synthase/dihydrofolate synthase [Planctomycetota bacterium]
MTSELRPSAGVPPFADFESALAWLRQKTDFERGPTPRATPHLVAMRALAAALDHPELAVPTLHVAGTKGKGSTCAFAAALLRRAGYKTGLYVSPHLSHLCERIAIDGQPIDPQRFAAHLDELARACASCAEGELASFFDLMTLAGFLAFRAARVDAAVIEVGMGGRLDSTNIVLPEATAITSISFDHMKVLGRSLPAIGREKAGIAKRDRPLVVGIERAHPAFDAIAAHAAEVGAPLRVLGQDFHWSHGDDEQEVRVETWRGRTLRARLPYAVPFHAKDLAIALALLEAGAERGKLPDIAPWLEGSGDDLRVPGRFELLRGSTPALLDGAHNDEAFVALAAALRKNFPERRLVAVIGAARDKLHSGVFAPLAPHLAYAVATRAEDNPRATRPADLAAQLRADGIPSSAVASAPEAWRRAVELREELGSPATDPILVTGSLYLVGELRPELLARASPPCSNSSKTSSSPTPS